MVGALLGTVGADDSRPEDLPKGVGLLESGYQLTEIQAQQILEMRLHRLTGLEQERLTDEYKVLLETIRGLIEILEDPDVLLAVIRTELNNVKEQYGDPRRTEIRQSEEDLDILDLINPEDMVVTLSHSGYVKRQPVSTYRAQRRGGRGRSATAMKDEDSIDQLWIANTHDTLLAFTSAGRVFWLPVFRLPEAGPNARGRPIINFIALEQGERIQAVQAVREYAEDRYVFFATARGKVKKTALTEYAYRLQRGKIAINLEEGDALIDAQLTDGGNDILLFASNGKTVRFAEAAVRPMGRTATGVRGIRLDDGESVVSLIVAVSAGDPAGAGDEAIDDQDESIEDDIIEAVGDETPVQDDDEPADIDYILTATENGYGKRTPLAEYPRKSRGTKGVIGIQCSERNGSLVGAALVNVSDEVLLISDGGTLVRTHVSEISRVSRNTQGVTLIRLGQGEKLASIEVVPPEDDDLDEAEADDENGATVESTPEVGE